MDKWKDLELEKMKHGGNRHAKDFLTKHSDWSDSAPMNTKYNSRAAALYRDKLATEAKGEAWSEANSSAKDHKSSYIAPASNYSSGSGSRQSSNIKSSTTHSSGFSDNGYQGQGGYQGGGGAPDLNSRDFKAQKDDFFGRKQNENAMRPENLHPNQGGKYAGFGNAVAPAKSNSVQDFYSLTGLTSSLSNMSVNALGSRVAEVGWKFTSIAGQKASEISDTVSEKVKDGNLLTDLTSSASNLAGKVTEAVGKKNFDLTSLWGSTRSEYQPCEDSGLLRSATFNGISSYQQDSLLDGDGGGGYSKQFSGFQSGTSGGQGGYNSQDFQENKSQRKRSDDWGKGWDESGWSDSPAKPNSSVENPKKSTTTKVGGSSKSKGEGMLIDLGADSSTKSSNQDDDAWNEDWEDDEAWEDLKN
jgi:ADP-ribosylation factor GTPase-activating protein 1